MTNLTPAPAAVLSAMAAPGLVVTALQPAGAYTRDPVTAPRGAVGVYLRAAPGFTGRGPSGRPVMPCRLPAGYVGYTTPLVTGYGPLAPPYAGGGWYYVAAWPRQ